MVIRVMDFCSYEIVKEATKRSRPVVGGQGFSIFRACDLIRVLQACRPKSFRRKRDKPSARAQAEGGWRQLVSYIRIRDKGAFRRFGKGNFLSPCHQKQAPFQEHRYQTPLNASLIWGELHLQRVPQGYRHPRVSGVPQFWAWFLCD